MVDTSQVSEPIGGASAFRDASAPTLLTPLPTGGLLLRITSRDAPGFEWSEKHPTTQSEWAHTQGGTFFREFLVAFSLSFTQSYLPLHRAEWALNVIGYNISGSPSPGNPTQWADSGSSVTGSSGLLEVGSTTVQVLGPSFARHRVIVYGQ